MSSSAFSLHFSRIASAYERRRDWSKRVALGRREVKGCWASGMADGGLLDHLLVDGSLPSSLSCGGLQCRRSASTGFCGGGEVTWVCEGFDDLTMFAEQCVDLFTQIPRYCCPESFLANCP